MSVSAQDDKILQCQNPQCTFFYSYQYFSIHISTLFYALYSSLGMRICGHGVLASLCRHAHMHRHMCGRACARGVCACARVGARVRVRVRSCVRACVCAPPSPPLPPQARMRDRAHAPTCAPHAWQVLRRRVGYAARLLTFRCDVTRSRTMTSSLHARPVAYGFMDAFFFECWCTWRVVG